MYEEHTEFFEYYTWEFSVNINIQYIIFLKISNKGLQISNFENV